MDRHDDTYSALERDGDTTVDEHETHATTGGAAAAGAVTGGVIGLAGGPLGAAIGAVGGAIIGVASERIMHSDDDRERARSAPPYDDGHVDDPTDSVVERTPIGRQPADARVDQPSEHGPTPPVRSARISADNRPIDSDEPGPPQPR